MEENSPGNTEDEHMSGEYEMDEAELQAMMYFQLYAQQESETHEHIIPSTYESPHVYSIKTISKSEKSSRLTEHSYNTTPSLYERDETSIRSFSNPVNSSTVSAAVGNSSSSVTNNVSASSYLSFGKKEKHILTNKSYDLPLGIDRNENEKAPETVSFSSCKTGVKSIHKIGEKRKQRECEQSVKGGIDTITLADNHSAQLIDFFSIVSDKQTESKHSFKNQSNIIPLPKAKQSDKEKSQFKRNYKKSLSKILRETKLKTTVDIAMISSNSEDSSNSSNDDEDDIPTRLKKLKMV